MKISKILFYTIIGVGLQQCKMPDSAKTEKDREIYILSGGSNAAYGHHVLKINKHGVNIDTSYFVDDYELYKGMDSSYFYRNLKKHRLS